MNRTKFAVTAAFLGLFANPSYSQTRPDFSGVWVMDSSRSESAKQEKPIGVERVSILQTKTTLRVETNRDGEIVVAVYPIKGVPDAVDAVTGERRAFWDGTTLVSEGSIDTHGQTTAFREARTVAEGGNEMVVETTLKMEHGYEMKGAKTIVTGKNVYVRGR